MSLLPDINFNDVPDSNIIPEGKYCLTPVKWEIKPTINKLGEILWVTFQVRNGEHKNKQFSYNYNARNKNPEAVRIGMMDLKRLLRACGHTGDIGPLTKELLDSIIGQLVECEVTVEKQVGYEDTNKIKNPKLFKQSGLNERKPVIQAEPVTTDDDLDATIESDVPF